jgi:hypothetical protein
MASKVSYLMPGDLDLLGALMVSNSANMTKNTNMTKYLPLVLMMIALVLGLSYLHESEVTSSNHDRLQSGVAAPLR